MAKIEKLHAREVLDSRGNPTVEVDIHTAEGLFRSIVPSGASTGVHEALELRDADKTRYLGKGVLKAVEHVNTEISNLVRGMDPCDQEALDLAIIEADGTENKSRFGANAVLAVSMAACKAGAAAKKIPLYQHIAELAGNNNIVLPTPSLNVLNGGRHAGNKLAMQEFMIMPTGADSFREGLRMAAETYQHLKKVIKSKYGLDAVNVGDEGGFAPNIQDNHEGLQLLQEAIDAAGYTGRIKIGMDIAASEFYTGEGYDLNFKDPALQGKEIKTGDEMIEVYRAFVDEYPIVSIEDPFDQEDWENFSKFTSQMGDKIEIIGDDLLVTNPRRIKTAIEKNAANGLLLKVNQIGTITESIRACNLSLSAGWGVMVSHRSGETEDSFIADLVVGLGTGSIKTGAPCRSERLAKYNQLLRIEEALGDSAGYTGESIRQQ